MEIKSKSLTSDSEGVLNENRAIRYFDNIDDRKCENCREMGHTKGFCLKNICNLCLGDH